MIFLWLWRIFRLILMLFIPPPPKPVIPRRDPNETCPSCGHRDGSLQAVERNGQMLVQHTCRICKAQWHEKPVLTVSNVIETEEKKG